jgi:Fe-S cluster assembly protein SufD
MTELSSLPPFVTAARAALGRPSAVRYPAWLGELKAQNAAWFLDHGLPGRKDEAWKYTSLNAIAEVAYEPLTGSLGRGLDPGTGGRLTIEPAHEVRLVNGQLELFAELPPGLEVLRLSEAIATVPQLVESYLGKLAPAGHALGALNTAMFQDGVLVRVRADNLVELPLHLTVLGGVAERAGVEYPRLLLVLDRGAELRLVEWHSQPHDQRLLSAPVAEIVLSEHASLEHTRVLSGSSQSFRVGVVAVRQGTRSRYLSRTFTLGGALSRLDLAVYLEGEEASSELEGLYYVRDSEHVDHHTVIDHRAIGGQSRQTYRGVVTDQGRAVFDGTVFVRPGAQRTAAHQENRHLVLSDTAVVDSKPRLEIQADDVKCGHGAAIGRLEPEQLFYLRCRGLPELDARALLVRAFADEMLLRVPWLELRQTLSRAFSHRLGEPDRRGCDSRTP